MSPLRRGNLMPAGFATEVAEPDLRVLRSTPTFETLKRLPGAMGWQFEVMQAASGVVLPGPIQNQGSLPPPPNGFTIGGGFEGLIDMISIRNIAIDSGSGVANLFYSLALNGVPLAGYENMGQLQESDGNGNWWANVNEFVQENTLIELWLLSNASPSGWVCGGRVHGWQWPIRSRMDWEAMHPER